MWLCHLVLYSTNPGPEPFPTLPKSLPRRLPSPAAAAAATKWPSLRSAYLSTISQVWGDSADHNGTLCSHTNANQNKKAHRNGIKKPKSNRYPSMRGVRSSFPSLYYNRADGDAG
ncbi:hypothetical protein CALVIDRAFT_478918 [Calocera viscosa TUFC12733]|uniref:60S ribosomal protein L29 n=1 Tax=Calocera viscosa (strain TUFC12733) TaxID=1330018 RepID=A0A167NSJ7_CALVF|nr:hypothetical protein CALVIDRAFT_478918 [Calocera viscosa TUFC12733]